MLAGTLAERPRDRWPPTSRRAWSADTAPARLDPSPAGTVDSNTMGASAASRSAACRRRHGRLRPSHDVQVPRAPRIENGAETQRHVHLHRLADVDAEERWVGDAHDDVRLAVERDRLADHVSRPTEFTLPESIPQHGGGRAAPNVVRFAQQAARRGPDAECREVGRHSPDCRVHFGPRRLTGG